MRSTASCWPTSTGPLRSRLDYRGAFFGRRPQDLVLHGQLPDLALSIPELAILRGSVGPLAFQAFLAAFQKVVAPGRQPVRLHLQLPGELFKGLAAQQPEHGLHFPARRPPGPGPVVARRLRLVFVVHRHDRHLHPCLPGVQENRERWNTSRVSHSKGHAHHHRSRPRSSPDHGQSHSHSTSHNQTEPQLTGWTRHPT
jgi:hypothetical protein